MLFQTASPAGLNKHTTVFSRVNTASAAAAGIHAAVAAKAAEDAGTEPKPPLPPAPTKPPPVGPARKVHLRVRGRVTSTILSNLKRNLFTRRAAFRAEWRHRRYGGNRRQCRLPQQKVFFLSGGYQTWGGIGATKDSPGWCS
jgi:hypothetical protein